jgi:serine/threonine protein kinase
MISQKKVEPKFHVSLSHPLLIHCQFETVFPTKACTKKKAIFIFLYLQGVDTMQELIGIKIGPYQIQSHLASGGMANVYLARNVENEAEPLVAIKLVHSSIKDYSERFRRESKELYALHHDHILPALAYGEYNSWCYLVTPYIEGGTLTSRLAQGSLSLQEATKIFSQLASALHYIHEQGIIHRDIKSSNILMRDENYAYLADFGLAKHPDFDDSLTLSGYLIGTPEYMAPELAETGASPSSDIYALGILLYQMLTGHVPFRGISPLNVYLKHMREWPVAPSVLNPSIPPEVEQVVLRALTKNPDERYQTAQDFNTAYQHALAQASARPSERTEVATRFLSTKLPIPEIKLVKTGNLHLPNEQQPRPATLARQRKQERGIATAIVTLALLLLSILSISGMNAQQTPPTQLTIQSGLIHGHETIRTPIPPTPPPVVTGQHPRDNANNGNNSGQGNHANNENKPDQSHHEGK